MTSIVIAVLAGAAATSGGQVDVRRPQTARPARRPGSAMPNTSTMPSAMLSRSPKIGSPGVSRGATTRSPAAPRRRRTRSPRRRASTTTAASMSCAWFAACRENRLLTATRKTDRQHRQHEITDTPRPCPRLTQRALPDSQGLKMSRFYTPLGPSHTLIVGVRQHAYIETMCAFGAYGEFGHHG